MYEKYAINARVEYRTPDGYNGCRHLPTFFLDCRQQGIVSEEHAEKIARDILDPFGKQGDDLKVDAIGVGQRGAPTTVHVVSFTPVDGVSVIGGFDWYRSRADAVARYEELAANPSDRVRLWTAYPLAEWDDAAITEYVQAILDDPGEDAWPDRDTHPGP